MAPSAQDAAIQAAETIQTAHFNRNPSVAHDVNPSTAASHKEPVGLKREPSGDDVLSDIDEDEIPVSLLRPTPRKPQMPPLPDLRFEQSYLASIKDANDWKVVAYITMRDQVVMPLVQGAAWTLIVAGWRFWNSGVKFSGETTGAKIRRWWWGVNNWTIPEHSSKLKDTTLADNAREFYEHQFSNAGAD